MRTNGLSLECRRVLVAEDQALVALELAETLRGWGCVVLGPVASNAEGLALLWRVRPDAALVDVTLAVWSGDLMVRVMDEPGRIVCPGFADGFVGREAT